MPISSLGKYMFWFRVRGAEFGRQAGNSNVQNADLDLTYSILFVSPCFLPSLLMCLSLEISGYISPNTKQSIFYRRKTGGASLWLCGMTERSLWWEVWGQLHCAKTTNHPLLDPHPPSVSHSLWCQAWASWGSVGRSDSLIMSILPSLYGFPETYTHRW